MNKLRLRFRLVNNFNSPSNSYYREMIRITSLLIKEQVRSYSSINKNLHRLRINQKFVGILLLHDTTALDRDPDSPVSKSKQKTIKNSYRLNNNKVNNNKELNYSVSPQLPLAVLLIMVHQCQENPL